jgi:uncharacterized phiE125 gp8 family phage protein
MFLEVVTPPDPVVILADAKLHLRVDAADEDDLIKALVAASTEHLDGPDGILNRALGLQTLKLTLDGFPEHDRRRTWPFSTGLPHGVPLPCQPIRAVTSIKYLDAAGAEQTVDAGVYELTADGRVRLAHEQQWPEPRSCRDPVSITYTAGYAVLPARLKQAILLMVGDLYANRSAQEISDSRVTAVLNVTVDRLLSPFIVRRA